VFFSLLTIFIIIGLYVLFLGDMFVSSMTDFPGARFLMDSWIMAGVLGITSISSTMGAFGIMVDDKDKKISKDFYTAPVKKSTLASGYILSTFFIGVIMSLVSLVLAEIYIIASGGELLPLKALIKTFGLIILSVISSSAMVFFAVFCNLNQTCTKNFFVVEVQDCLQKNLLECLANILYCLIMNRKCYFVTGRNGCTQQL
jgi:multidrug/hemolysin transport system permease protein